MHQRAAAGCGAYVADRTPHQAGHTRTCPKAASSWSICEIPFSTGTTQCGGPHHMQYHIDARIKVVRLAGKYKSVVVGLHFCGRNFTFSVILSMMLSTIGLCAVICCARFPRTRNVTCTPPCIVGYRALYPVSHLMRDDHSALLKRNPDSCIDAAWASTSDLDRPH